MSKLMTSHALRLKEYIDALPSFAFIDTPACPYSGHIGALFTDTILQAGLNYRSVVLPRVEHVLQDFPDAVTVSAFARALFTQGTGNVLRWKNHIKIRRIEELVSFCGDHSIETASDLAAFLTTSTGEAGIKRLNGIGDKTCDYLKRLLGVDTVAVDRHIRGFLAEAGIDTGSYSEVKAIVEFAADFLSVSRRTLDYSIWVYMSTQNS